ncbi:hypothetical protein N9139_02310 [Akkermansiaceae bacterium]|nr:hypothetical protein [Akkermansiaceae bacterium]
MTKEFINQRSQKVAFLRLGEGSRETYSGADWDIAVGAKGESLELAAQHFGDALIEVEHSYVHQQFYDWGGLDLLEVFEWIKNTTIGDGLGMTGEELDRIERYTLEGRDLTGTASGLTVQQESFLIVGNYHSGPVHTVRAVGYVGLFFLLIAQLVIMSKAIKTIRRYWNSHWRMDVLFVGIPLIGFPISWWFLFGEFDGATKSVLIGAGLLRLISNNLDPDEVELT